MSSDVYVRPATLEDSDAIATIYAGAFPHLFRFALGLGERDSVSLLRDFYRLKVLPLDGLFVADVAGEVGGFVSLRIGKPKASPDIQAFWSTLVDHVGRARAVRAMLGSIMLSLIFGGRAPRGDMAYVDTLAAAESMRRRGVGTALLDHCEVLAREAECVAIALHVVRTNAPARALYERQGYRGLPDERWLPRVINRVSRNRGTQLMVKQLEGI